jgi:RNA polymerase sigma-70 factor (ECF subfamily)
MRAVLLRLAQHHDSERDLVARVRDGEEAAFRQVFLEHYEAMAQSAYRVLGTREAAEDVVQSVFRRIWERRAVWEPTLNIRAYLLGATRNAALNEVRRLSMVDRVERRLTGDGRTPGMSTAPAPIEEIVQAAELAAAIEEAAAQLTPRCRDVFQRRWQNGLTVPETARLLGLAPKTVEMYWTKALVAIRERVRRFR